MDEKTTKPQPPTTGQFKKGNKLYKLREYTLTGYKLSLDELIQGARDYIKYAKAHPIIEKQLHQKTGKLIDIPKERPLTIEGLCNYIGIGVTTLYQYTKQKDNETTEERERRDAYTKVIARIKQIIYDDKLTGAAAGIYNANIIIRDLGLTDKKEIQETAPKRIKIELINDITTGAATPHQYNPNNNHATPRAFLPSNQPQEESAQAEEIQPQETPTGDAHAIDSKQAKTP